MVTTLHCRFDYKTADHFSMPDTSTLTFVHYSHSYFKQSFLYFDLDVGII